jgi:hypothetical protein
MIRLSRARALLYGTLVVGILDLADAFVFFGLRGARPINHESRITNRESRIVESELSIQGFRIRDQ